MMNFAGKVVVITGAGTGIGAGLARKLLLEGAHVVLVGRRREKLLDVIAQSTNQQNATALTADISKHKDLRNLVQSVLEKHGRIEVLINNAGTGYGGALTDVQPEEVEYLIKVNLVAQIWLTQLVVPILCEQKEGMIVNVASVAGLVPIPNQSFYSATKHGLSGFSRALRRELLGTSVDVVTVYPGGVESEMMSDTVRRNMTENDFSLAGMMKPETAADIIVDGMTKRRPNIYVTSGMERQLVRLNHLLPGLVDRRLKAIRPKIRKIMTASTEEVRGRTLLPKLE